MSNYLAEIENEYSRARGKPSMLSPVDWQLAARWEKSGVPLHVVLRAMGDVTQKFHAQKRTDSINSLRYFTQEVEKQFTEWNSRQAGKSIVTVGLDPACGVSEQSQNIVIMEGNEMQNLSFAEATVLGNEYIETLETLAARFKKTNLPEPIASAAAEVRRELLIIIEEVGSKQLSSDEIEDRLKEMSESLQLPLATSLSEQERAELLKSTKAEYGKIRMTDELLQKVLIRKLNQRFGLPELTLFAF